MKPVTAMGVLFCVLPLALSAQGVQRGYKGPCLAADFETAANYLEVAAGSEPGILGAEARDTPQFRALPEFARFVDADLQSVSSAESTAYGVFVPPCLEKAREALRHALTAHVKAVTIYKAKKRTTDAAYRRERQAAMAGYAAYREAFRVAKSQVTK